PAIKRSGPAIKRSGPAIKRSGPTIKRSGPAIEQSGPIKRQTAQSSGQTAPSSGQAPPSSGQDPPSSGQDPPSSGQAPPSKKRPVSAVPSAQIQATHGRSPQPGPDGQRMPPPPPRGAAAAASWAATATPDSQLPTAVSRVQRLLRRPVAVSAFIIEQRSRFQFEFRVLYGGRLDIDVYIVGPAGAAWPTRVGNGARAASWRRPLRSRRSRAGESPVHTVCLDNRHSSWYDKVVDFRIELQRKRINGGGGEMLEPLPEAMTAELKRLDISWSHFLTLTWAVEDNLHRSASIQREFRVDETRDRLAMEDSAARVSRWSALQLAVMLGVSGLQVLMIRSLFDEKSVLHRVWRVAARS
uniref:GOLD domain-containing protein n=1 Tax=Macrostomum lignano TaxID=282301 RepID=A0A1I8FPE8_9PLAT